MTPYAPKRASAFFISSPDLAREGCIPIDRTVEAAFGRPSSAAPFWTSALARTDLAALLAKVPTNAGATRLCTKTEVFAVGLLPWLPGADNTASADRWRRQHGGQ